MGLESILRDFLKEHGGDSEDGKRLSETAGRVIILHGTSSAPEANWFPWLKKRLESRSVRVEVPRLPTPGGQDLPSWFKAFDAQVPTLTEGSVLVGHSIGAAFALRLLERHGQPIAGVCLISAWEGLLGNEHFDPLIRTFFLEALQYETLRKNAHRIIQYHGDNDPYVPLALAEALAAHLQSELTVVPNGGHLNTQSGYVSFLPLLEDVLRLLDASSEDRTE